MLSSKRGRTLQPRKQKKALKKTRLVGLFHFCQLSRDEIGVKSAFPYNSRKINQHSCVFQELKGFSNRVRLTSRNEEQTRRPSDRALVKDIKEHRKVGFDPNVTPITLIYHCNKSHFSQSVHAARQKCCLCLRTSNLIIFFSKSSCSSEQFLCVKSLEQKQKHSKTQSKKGE